MQWGGSVLGVGGQDGNGWTGGSLALDVGPSNSDLGDDSEPQPLPAPGSPAAPLLWAGWDPVVYRAL